MNLAVIRLTGILRSSSILRAGAVNVIARVLAVVAVAAAVLTAAPVNTVSSEYDAAITRALTLPVKDALRGLDSLSRVQDVPGWVRAKSLKLLGDHQFMKADYKKAADFYQQASKFDNSSLYKHLYALALAADGKLGAARDIWNALAGDGADIMSGEAASLLRETGGGEGGQSVLTPPTRVDDRVNPPAAKDENKSVLTVQVQQATSGNPTANISSTNNVQQATTSNSTGNLPPPTAVVTADAGKTPPPLVSNQNQQSPTSNPTTNISQSSQVQQVTSGNQQQKITLFTVQIGAFGSRENADNLVKKLAATYSDITISPTTSGDQTLYRVRIGTFENRDDAVAFADKLITTAGLSARVFEK